MDAETAARRWAEVWTSAWPARNADAIAALYSNDASYRALAFREADLGLTGVRRSHRGFGVVVAVRLMAKRHVLCGGQIPDDGRERQHREHRPTRPPVRPLREQEEHAAGSERGEDQHAHADDQQVGARHERERLIGGHVGAPEAQPHDGPADDVDEADGARDRAGERADAGHELFER